jgi:DHA3 family macrolide efflux protein-like MFS transporter
VNTVNVEHARGQEDAVPASGVRTYALLFATQWFAMTATALTGLVLGIYLYRRYDSLVALGIAYAFPYLPFVFASPFAGGVVDRWGQRRALLVANIGTLVNSSVLVVLLLTHTLPWAVATVILGIAAAFKGLQLAALESSVPLLVPKRHILQANGSRMLLTGTAAVMAPVLVGLLLLVFPQIVIILLECAAVTLAIVTARAVRIPRATPAARTPRGTLRADIRRAGSSLKSRHGLLALLGFLGAISIIIGIIEVALPEIVYAFTNAGSLALILTSAWVGMLVVSIAITIWGRPRRLVRGMLSAALVFAAGMILSGLRPNVVLIAVAAFVAMGVTPIIMATIHTVLHTKVEPGMMGRTIGIKNTVIGGAHLTGNAVAGLLGAAARPLVGPHDVRSPALAAVVGHGPGRWYAVLMVLIGLVVVLIVYRASRSRALSRVQDDLPDVTPEDRPAPVAATPTVAAPVSATR